MDKISRNIHSCWKIVYNGSANWSFLKIIFRFRHELRQKPLCPYRLSTVEFAIHRLGDDFPFLSVGRIDCGFFGLQYGPATRDVGDGYVIEIRHSHLAYGIKYPSEDRSRELPFMGQSKPEYEFDSRFVYLSGEIDPGHVSLAHLKKTAPEDDVAVFPNPAYLILDKQTGILSDPVVEAEFEQISGRAAASFDWKILEYTAADSAGITRFILVFSLLSIFVIIGLPVLLIYILARPFVMLPGKRPDKEPRK